MQVRVLSGVRSRRPKDRALDYESRNGSSSLPETSENCAHRPKDRTLPSEGRDRGSSPCERAAEWGSQVVPAGLITRRSRCSNPASATNRRAATWRTADRRLQMSGGSMAGFRGGRRGSYPRPQGFESLLCHRGVSGWPDPETGTTSARSTPPSGRGLVGKPPRSGRGVVRVRLPPARPEISRALGRTERRLAYTQEAGVQLPQCPPCQGGEMVDALGSEPSGRDPVQVRLLSLALRYGGEMVDTLARGASGREAVLVRLQSVAPTRVW